MAIYYISEFLIAIALLMLYVVYKYTTTGKLKRKPTSPIELGGRELRRLKKIDNINIEEIFPREAIDAMKDYEDT